MAAHIIYVEVYNMSKVFIPKQYKKEPTTIRLTPEKLERIDKYAAVYNVSRSEFLNQCIDFEIGRASCRERV